MRRQPISPPRSWKLHETKARFGELFRLKQSDGPQRIVKQRGEAVVTMPAAQFDQMCKRADAALYRAKELGRNRVCS